MSSRMQSDKYCDNQGKPSLRDSERPQSAHRDDAHRHLLNHEMISRICTLFFGGVLAHAVSVIGFVVANGIWLQRGPHWEALLRGALWGAVGGYCIGVIAAAIWPKPPVFISMVVPASMTWAAIGVLHWAST